MWVNIARKQSTKVWLVDKEILDSRKINEVLEKPGTITIEYFVNTSKLDSGQRLRVDEAKDCLVVHREPKK